jgi:L-ascorbate metabolism protein UlaG (beta-lactamase superfamily)
MLENVSWLGHSGFRIKGRVTVYIDPYQIKGREPADVVLITHGHYDHFSPGDIRKILKSDTVIVKPGKPDPGLTATFQIVRPGEQITVKGVPIQVVPAYNAGKPFHPRSAGNAGYVFTLDETTYYHAGDSDFIPEMKDIRCDAAFLPVGGTYTMNADEAAQAAATIRPKIAVPMHWGDVVGSRRDAERFAERAECEVRIMEIKE